MSNFQVFTLYLVVSSQVFQLLIRLIVFPSFCSLTNFLDVILEFRSNFLTYLSAVVIWQVFFLFLLLEFSDSESDFSSFQSDSLFTFRTENWKLRKDWDFGVRRPPGPGYGLLIFSALLSFRKSKQQELVVVWYLNLDSGSWKTKNAKTRLWDLKIMDNLIL